jgi:phytanoyl-CoA hydroxylase
MRLRHRISRLLRPAQPPPPPAFMSKSGRLWIDEPDWLDILAHKRWNGEFSEGLCGQIFRFVRDGYIIIPQAVPADLLDRLDTEMESLWHAPPLGLLIETYEPDNRLKYIPPAVEYRAGNTRLLDAFAFSAAARAAIANPPAMEFLHAIFGARPKAMQSLSFWNGSQQPIHKDTAYVRVDTGAMRLAATWLALEDVEAGTGELEYYIGSHRAPAFMFGGESRWMEYKPEQHANFLSSLHEDAQRLKHPRGSFLGKKGDLLIWHADLAHGGAQITRSGRSRRSLVAHFCAEADEPYYRRHSQFKELTMDDCVFVSAFADVR